MNERQSLMSAMQGLVDYARELEGQLFDDDAEGPAIVRAISAMHSGWRHSNGENEDGTCSSCQDDMNDEREQHGALGPHPAELDTSWPSGDLAEPSCAICGHDIEGDQ